MYDIYDVAVHGDQVILLTGKGHPKSFGLQLLDLDGRFLRMIVARWFDGPQAIAASHGRVFVVDEDEVDDDDEGSDDDDGVKLFKILHVIDMQSGDLLQTVGFELEGQVSAIIVDGDEIYIAGFTAGQIVVLQLAGSEA